MKYSSWVRKCEETGDVNVIKTRIISILSSCMWNPSPMMMETATRKRPSVSPMPAACKRFMIKPNRLAPSTAAVKQIIAVMRQTAHSPNLIHSKII